MKLIARSFVVSFALASLLVACGKSSSSAPTPTEAAPAGAAPANAKPGDTAGKAIVATCVKGTTTCVEYRTTLPDHVEEMCKAGPDYVFRKGPTPCPTDKVAGTCTNKLTPDETSYWYGTSPEDAELAKGLCEIMGQWTPAPKGGASAGKGPAPTPTGKNAKNAKK